MKKTNLLLTGLFLFIASNVIAEETYFNPLKRWARYNVDALNTFATGDEKTVLGKLYQFGRNVAFPNDATLVDYETGTFEVTDSKIWGDKMLFSTSTRNSNNWHTTPAESGWATWADIVTATMEGNGAPTSYLGANSGDPCPEGWHLPTVEEVGILITGTGNVAFHSSATVNVSDVSETIDLYGDGNPQEYTADYKKIATNVVVALRFKGSSNVSAFRYRLVDYALENGHVEISVKAAGSANIAAIEAWNDAAWDDAEVRYFPMTGYRLNNDTGEGVKRQGWGGTNGRLFLWTNRIWDPKYATSYGGLDGTSTRPFQVFEKTYSRSYAFPCRCIQDYGTGLSTSTATGANAIEPQVWVSNGLLYISGAVAETRLSVYNMLGALVFEGKLSSDELSINLPSNLYIVKIGGKSVKVAL